MTKLKSERRAANLNKFVRTPILSYVSVKIGESEYGVAQCINGVEVALVN